MSSFLPRPPYTIPLIYTVTFLFLFGLSLQPAPRTQIYETIICENFYQSHPHHPNHNQDAHIQKDCKIPPIQQELALVGGIERLTILIPSLLSIPFAALADRLGHSSILSLAIFGCLLEEAWALLICSFPAVFPLRLVWLHFIFGGLGGGITVVVSLLHVIVAAVVEGAEQRTKVFFRLRAAGVGASVLGYAVSGVVMRRWVWVPWWVGLGSLAGATGVGTCLPVTKGEGVEDEARHRDHKMGWRERFGASGQLFVRIWRLLVGNRQILVMLVLVLLCQLGFDSLPLMMIIYVSKRYGWKFSDANLLNSLEMMFEFIVLVFLLPVVTSLLSRSKLSPFGRDKLIAQASIAALAIGAIFLGLAPVVPLAIIGISVMALGAGQDSALRSITTEMVDASDVSIVYSAITMLRAIGGSVSGPVFAGLYGVGLRISESWLGLPYIVAGLLFALAFLLLMLLKEPSGYELVSENEPEEEPLRP
ncbi:MFS general substrate transporter [Corynespora cassiicola Philippines]|uniref:MFS general substrate transporter n=1 Tax=Corynespora cassiicola Philippines TaxID=1448308 RepID=A0A2T2PD41_CORCC|nr:MFS general substrate transporter [Corynespora cassiicola Philippines]